MSERESKEAKNEAPEVRWGRSVKETLREKVDGKGAKTGFGGKTHFDRWNGTRDKEERDALPPAEVKKFLGYVRGQLDRRMGDKSFNVVRSLGSARKKVESAKKQYDAAIHAVDSTELGQTHKEWRTNLPTSDRSVVALMNTPEFKAFEPIEAAYSEASKHLKSVEETAEGLGKELAKREAEYKNLAEKVTQFTFLENGGNPAKYPKESNRAFWKLVWKDVLHSGLLGGITELNLDDVVFTGRTSSTETVTETKPAPVVASAEGSSETTTPSLEGVASVEGDPSATEARSEAVDSHESSPSEAETKVEETDKLFVEAGGTFTPTPEQEAQIGEYRFAEILGGLKLDAGTVEKFKDIEKLDAELLAAATAFVAEPENLAKRGALARAMQNRDDAVYALQKERINGRMDMGRGYTEEVDASRSTPKDSEAVDWSKVDFGTPDAGGEGAAKPDGKEEKGRPPRTPEEDAQRAELLSQIHTLHLQMEQLLQINDSIASKYIKKGHHGAPMDGTNPLTMEGTIYIGDVQLRYAKLGVKLDGMATELKEKFGDIWPKTVDQKMIVLDKSGAMPAVMHLAENHGLRRYIRYMPPKEFERLVAKARAKREKLKTAKDGLAKTAEAAGAGATGETAAAKEEREFGERIDKVMEGFINGGKPEGRGGRLGKENFKEMLSWIPGKFGEKNREKARDVYLKAVLKAIGTSDASYAAKESVLKRDILGTIVDEGTIEKGLLRVTKELPKIMRDVNKRERTEIFTDEDIKASQRLANYAKKPTLF